MRRPTVLLADDHVIFIDGLSQLLKDRFDVTGSVTDGSLLLDAARRLRPDVIVTDISMPAVSGLEGLRRLNLPHEQWRVVVLTMHADPRLAVEAFRLGAKGYVLKESSGEELVRAIDAVVDGHKYISASLTEDVLALMSQPSTRVRDLTIRQQEVLRLVVNGHRTKEIAASLELSPRTVETIKYEMMRDIDVHSTTALVRYAIEHRLVDF
jgi:DNA-binding NarL/FixJ family response regulator